MDTLSLSAIVIMTLVSLIDVKCSPVVEHQDDKATNWMQCNSFKDCSHDECCVALHRSKVRVCKKRPVFGNRCIPSILPGFGDSCPCSVGLTCALTAFDNLGRGKDKFHCVLVPEFLQELEEHKRHQ